MTRSMFERWSSRLAIAGVMLTFAVGILLPVYTDEIGWRFQERAWVDGVDEMFNDLCGANTLARPPWFMMPLRWFSAIVNQTFADPWFIRVEGVACGLAWLGLLWVLTGRLECNAENRRRLRMLAFSMFGLGTLPFLMVLSRPEQPLILSLTLMILLAFAKLPSIDVRAQVWLKVTGILLLTDIAVSYHVKGVAYIPVAFACLAVLGKGRENLRARLLGTGVLFALALSAAHYWITRFRCLGDPKMAQKLAGENIASTIASHGHLHDLLLQLAGGFNLTTYILLALPDNEPMSNWVPPDMFPMAAVYAMGSALGFVWIFGIIGALAMLGRFLWHERLTGLSEPRVPLALSTLACVIVWGASQINQNVYEAAHILPMLAIFVVLCLTLPAGESSWIRRGAGWVALTSVPLALLSEIALIFLSGREIYAAAQTPGYLVAQPYSVSIAGFAEIKHDINRAMTEAGMNTRRRYRRLLIDDITYLALQRNLLPFHQLGVLRGWTGSIDDPVQYLVSRHSDGVVMSCDNLPMHLEVAASRAGGICAISRNMLVQLSASPPDIWAESSPPQGHRLTPAPPSKPR